LPGGTPILFALAALRSVPQAGSQFRGLATAIHEISELVVMIVRNNKSQVFLQVKEKKSFPMLSDRLLLRAKGM
jgi:hypothetical protein